MRKTGAASPWAAPPAEASIDRDEAHVWRAALDVKEPLANVLGSCLAPDERARAARFRRERDRVRFVAARGILRDILARYLRVAPANIRFSYTRYGKPHLDERGGAGGLTFNVSHSGNLALYAITRQRDVGIDVETVDRDMEWMELAERSFSTGEVEALRAVPEQERRQAFFRLWTRKEAYVKARGMGLSISLDRFTVSVQPGEPILLAVDGDPSESTRWTFGNLDAGAAYAATLAVEGAGWRLRRWQWEPPPA